MGIIWKQMKFTILAAVFSLATTVLFFFCLIYPAWFSQHYRKGEVDLFQGFGVWSFHSTSFLQDPFYASETTLTYSNFCDNLSNPPNWMLGVTNQYSEVLCGSSIVLIQVAVSVATALSFVSLVASVYAIYCPRVSIAERLISFLTFFSGLLLSVGMMLWGWLVQGRLHQVDSISLQYSMCETSQDDWSCWFYGVSFWIALSAVIATAITGYISSLGANEKHIKLPPVNDAELQVAIAMSLQEEQSNNPYKSSETSRAGHQQGNFV